MRLPYIPEDPNLPDPEDQAVVGRIRERRAGGKLIALDRALLHAPPVADGWYVKGPQLMHSVVSCVCLFWTG